jgi:hypothetical protein
VPSSPNRVFRQHHKNKKGGLSAALYILKTFI